MLVLGYMSGTSLDGVDAALIDTDGERIAEVDAATLIPFATAERRVIEAATRDALMWNGLGDRPASFASAGAVVTDAHVRAGEQVIAEAGRRPELIGFHGQTVLHRPERRLSVQIGDPQVLADALGIPVVARLRQHDLAAGGQGAPLVPIYHAALAERLRRKSGLELPVAFLNVGGVANLTWIGRDGRLIAFDTGPGNGLIDLAVQARGVGRYDDGGRLAAAGTIDEERLADLLAHPFFTVPGPKSLDRYDFPLTWSEELPLEDVAATLTAFTGASVGLAAQTLPEPPASWIVCGGGGHNPTLMAVLRSVLGDCRTADDVGLRSDFVEAEAMAFLAARHRRGLPITFPETTGVPEAMSGGTLFRPQTNTS